ncbi:MAG: ribonuclease H-like domain-containing protein [Candidatus Woesearchaeota archaeon]
MLKNTFLHIPYVNEKTEFFLWQNGFLDWESCLNCNKKIISQMDLLKKFILLSIKNYQNHEFFSQRLEAKHHWRAYPDFKEKACFLDIETTGLDKKKDDITLIGIYEPITQKAKFFILGKNMHLFENEIKKYSYLITFNGFLFDLPFIREKFNIELNQLHSDLRFLLCKLGYTGGLKKIENDLGLIRNTNVKDGLEAIKLWNYYKKYNDEISLHKLIDYNYEDIKNLHFLMEFAYENLKKQIFERIN